MNCTYFDTCFVLHSSLELPYDMEKLEKKEKSKKKALKLQSLKGKWTTISAYRIKHQFSAFCHCCLFLSLIFYHSVLIFITYLFPFRF